MRTKGFILIVFALFAAGLLVATVSAQRPRRPIPTRNPENQPLATARAVLTESVPEVQATVASARATLTAAGDRIDDIIDYDAETATLTFTVMEASLNATVDRVLQARGYDDVSVTVDLVPGGTVTTYENLPLPDGSTMIVEGTLTLVDGSVQYEVVSVTVDGSEVPPAIVDEITASIRAAVTEAVMNFTDQLPDYEFEAEYTITDLVVTDSEIIVTVALAEPLPTPRPTREWRRR